MKNKALETVAESQGIVSKGSKEGELQVQISSHQAKEQSITSFFPKEAQSQKELSCSTEKRIAEVISRVSNERENKFREFNESRRIVPEISNSRRMADESSRAIMEEEFNKGYAMITGPNYPEPKREWSDRKDQFPKGSLLSLNVKIDPSKSVDPESSKLNFNPSSFPVSNSHKPALEANSRLRIIPEAQRVRRVSQLNSPVAKTSTLHDYMSSGSKKVQDKDEDKKRNNSQRFKNGLDLKGRKSEDKAQINPARPTLSPPINFPVPRPPGKGEKEIRPKTKGTKMQSQIPVMDSGRGNSRSGGQTSLDAFISNGGKKELPDPSKKPSKSKKEGSERGKERQGQFVDVIRGEPVEPSQGRRGPSRGKGNSSGWEAILAAKK
jgi:predicted secreted protein